MTFGDLEHATGITFQDKNLLKLAFIHRSYLNEDKTAAASNERLEFLGDAVLSFLTSEYLYNTYPEYPEGTLTNVRSSLVKTTSLSNIAMTLHLGDLLLVSRGEEASGGRTNMSLLADVFEAFLGAMFLDRGIGTCRSFLAAQLFPHAASIIATKSYLDFKSLLQEVVQRERKTSPLYTVVNSEGPDHARTFWVEARIGDTVMGSGKGKSKQEAEQHAAQNALAGMGKI